MGERTILLAVAAGGDWTSAGSSVVANLVLGIGAAFIGLRLGSL